MMEVLQKIYKGRFSWNAAYGGEGERSLGIPPNPRQGLRPWTLLPKNLLLQSSRKGVLTSSTGK